MMFVFQKGHGSVWGMPWWSPSQFAHTLLFLLLTGVTFQHIPYKDWRAEFICTNINTSLTGSERNIFNYLSYSKGELYGQYPGYKHLLTYLKLCIRS
jgi:hypothetical protein